MWTPLNCKIQAGSFSVQFYDNAPNIPHNFHKQCQLWLNNLAVLTIEEELLDAMDIDSAIKDFASRKSKKVDE